VFQDDLHSAKESAALHQAYGRMADAVCESLGSYLWVVGELFETFLKSQNDIHAVPALLLMEYAEPIDGVSILARVGSAKNCTQLLRTGMELQLNVMFLMEGDDTYEQRCLAYEYFHFQNQLRVAQKCDPNTEVGKQVRGQSRDEPLGDIFDRTSSDIQSEIKALQAKVNSARYAAVRAEVARTKSKRWYGLWNGPANVEALAGRLKQHAIYETLYRYWSSASHGESALKRMILGKAEGLQMQPVRSPAGLPAACRHACSLANSMTLFIVDKRLPHLHPEMANRFIERIKPGLDYIDSVQGLDG